MPKLKSPYGVDVEVSGDLAEVLIGAGWVKVGDSEAPKPRKAPARKTAAPKPVATTEDLSPEVPDGDSTA